LTEWASIEYSQVIDNLKGVLIMTPKQSISAVDEHGKLLYESDGDLLRASLEKRYNLLLELEVESKTGAAKNQRSGAGPMIVMAPAQGTWIPRLGGYSLIYPNCAMVVISVSLPGCHLSQSS
jgi:hypothetical protein